MGSKGYISQNRKENVEDERNDGKSQEPVSTSL
jgi:hypothetical protein